MSGARKSQLKVPGRARTPREVWIIFGKEGVRAVEQIHARSLIHSPSLASRVNHANESGNVHDVSE